MDLLAGLSDVAGDEMICSARGCRSVAVWALRWNNPRLHDESRRKVWLACDEHEVSLREFLTMRGFYRDTVAVSDLNRGDG